MSEEAQIQANKPQNEDPHTPCPAPTLLSTGGGSLIPTTSHLQCRQLLKEPAECDKKTACLQEKTPQTPGKAGSATARGQGFTVSLVQQKKISPVACVGKCSPGKGG